MRNFLTLVALLLSSTGIFVSLAREELRCRIGLSSSECSPSLAQPQTPNPIVESGQGIGGGQRSDSPETAATNRGSISATIEEIRDKVTPTEPTTTLEQIPPQTAIANPLSSDKQGEGITAPDRQAEAEVKQTDATVFGGAGQKKATPVSAPIAPPASKTAEDNNAIQVIPAEGSAIPVTPATQE